MKLVQSTVEIVRRTCSIKQALLDEAAMIAHIILAVWLLFSACALAEQVDPSSGTADNAQESSKTALKSGKAKQMSSEEGKEAVSDQRKPLEGDVQAKDGDHPPDADSKQLQSYDQQTDVEHDNPIVSGDLTLDYRGRWAGKQEDHDLAEYLSFRTDRLYDDKLSVAGLLRSTQRLDGRQSQDALFRDILDTYDHGFNPRFYYLYADVNDLADESLLRIGRQYIDEHEAILVDGAKWAQSFSNGDYYLFGGRRATQYTEADGDAAFGGGFSVSPWVDTKAAVDYARVEDDEFDDDMMSFRVRQGFPEDHLDFYGRVRVLNEDARDLLLTLTWDYPKYDITAQASYFRLLTAQRELGDNFTPFFQILQQLSRYQDTELTVTKGIGEHFSIFGGFNNRDVIGREEVDTFNRNYNRFFIGFNITDIFLKGLDFDLTADHWDTAGSGDRITAISAELRKAITEKLNVALGTNFSKFRFGRLDDFSMEPMPVTDEVLRSSYDRVNVRTYYGVLKYDVTENSYIRFRLEAESTSDVSPDIYTVGLTFGWSF